MSDVVLAAIRERLTELGQTQAFLGVAVAEDEGLDVPFSQSAVSDWVNGTDRLPPARLFAIERALGLPPGRLSRHLGYVPADVQPVTTVLEALDADPLLGEVQRTMVRATYEAAVKGK